MNVRWECEVGILGGVDSEIIRGRGQGGGGGQDLKIC